MLFTVRREEEKTRIDVFTAQNAALTRSQAHKLIQSDGVLVNGEAVKPNYRVRPGDRIEIIVPEIAVEELLPEDLPVDFIYRDEHIAVINKPPGMVVHPAAGNPGGTLMNALCHSLGPLATIGAPLRPGVVHRLDKDTSGVMVVALDDPSYYGLVEQFASRAVKKSYIALVWGNPKEDRGEITLRIGRSRSDRKKMSTSAKAGKEAHTVWEAIERFGPATLVRARISTGRTHQIRVHMATTGHPVLGDKTYGRKTEVKLRGGEALKFARQMLHARRLSFTHPVTKKKLSYKSPLPADMEDALTTLRAG